MLDSSSFWCPDCETPTMIIRTGASARKCLVCGRKECVSAPAEGYILDKKANVARKEEGN